MDAPMPLLCMFVGGPLDGQDHAVPPEFRGGLPDVYRALVRTTTLSLAPIAAHQAFTVPPCREALYRYAGDARYVFERYRAVP